MRNGKQFFFARSMGMISGLPDISIAQNGKLYFIELKTETGKLSKNQINFHKILDNNNIPVAVCRSLDNVVQVLTAWGVLNV